MDYLSTISKQHRLVLLLLFSSNIPQIFCVHIIEIRQQKLFNIKLKQIQFFQGSEMAKPIMIMIKPTTVHIMAFNLGPPGAFINLSRLGFMNVAIPISVTTVPIIRSIVFVIPMFCPFFT